MISKLLRAGLALTAVALTVVVSGFLATVALAELVSRTVIAQQTSHAIPRPPVIKITPDDGSAAPDGYAPIPEWLGQTRAPRPSKTAEYAVETVAEGFTGAFCFSFLPEGPSTRAPTGGSLGGGRIIVGERLGHVKIVGTDGKRPRSAGCRRICLRKDLKVLLNAEARMENPSAGTEENELTFVVDSAVERRPGANRRAAGRSA